MRYKQKYLTACFLCVLLVIILFETTNFYSNKIAISFIGDYTIYERRLQAVIDQNSTLKAFKGNKNNTYQVNLKKTLIKPLTYVSMLCSVPVKARSVPFVWHDDKHYWYNITQQPVFNNSLISFGTITLDEEHILGLLRNKRDSYRLLGNLIRQNESNPFKKTDESGDILKGRTAMFSNVLVSGEGHVLHMQKCIAVINGGCKSSASLSVFGKLVPVYDRVVSISAYWGSGIWHFLMEAFVGLAYVSRKEMEISFIHVSSKNSWTMNWLKIAGISENKIITGNVVAKTLILPEMGRCGTPSYAHVQWLRTIIPSKIPKHPRSIVLIKRTKKRAMQNKELQQLVQNFARKNNLQFILHTDNSLPPIPEQLQRFANASTVIGPHGAGLVNLIASKPGTCVIELLPPSPNVCYMRLSALLGHTYFSVPLYKNKIVNIQKVNETLHLCNNHE